MTQREPRIQDAKHLAFVRLQACCVCRKAGPSEAAHIRIACPARGKRSTGMQEKPHDKWTVPMCAYHHRTGIQAQHKMGERDFWIMVGRDPFEIALTFWNASGAALRHQTPPKPKPRKTRKPTPQIKRIWPSRPIQSRSTFEKRT